MPPVVAGIAALGGALTSAGLGVGAALGLSAGASFAAMGVFQQLAMGVALSALSQALAPKPRQGGTQGGTQGTKLSVTLGEQSPQSFIMGRYVTAGDLVFAGSTGASDDAPNSVYTQVIELADIPSKIRRVWINGEWIELLKTRNSRYGFPVKQYRVKSKDYLWVTGYNNAIFADPGMLTLYGSGEVHTWESDMIGRGIPYAIVHARLNADLHRGKPDCRFEMEGMALYDPRSDSSNGGSGAQRWANRATWTSSDNPAVMIYNILRGIYDPITGEFMWGGQGISASDLPKSSWFAAMSECDRAEVISGGTEPQYRAGIEIRTNEEPASIIEELLKACNGQIAEVAGQWTIRCGAPPLPVYSFTDDDVIVTSPDNFDPFPRMEQTYNGAHGSYPEPGDGYAPRDASPRYRADLEAEDGGRRQVADLTFTAVPYRKQVLRLMNAYLKDNRRFRRHTLVLSPEARGLGPLDVVSWTSARNGYIAKHFTLDLVEDLPGGNTALALREVDPDDYDPDVDIPDTIADSVRPPRPLKVPDFTVAAATILDADGVSRRPAIRLTWIKVSGVDAIRYRVRLAGTLTHIPSNAQAAAPDDEEAESNVLTMSGVPLLMSGEALTYMSFTNVADGAALISAGIMPNTAYEVQAIYVPTVGKAWSAWLPVTTGDIKIKTVDIDDDAISADPSVYNAGEIGYNGTSEWRTIVETTIDKIRSTPIEIVTDWEIRNRDGVTGTIDLRLFRTGGGPDAEMWIRTYSITPDYVQITRRYFDTDSWNNVRSFELQVKNNAVTVDWITRKRLMWINQAAVLKK